jgi:hypothetical protein
MARRTIRYSNALSTRKSVITGPRSIPRIGRNDDCPCGSGKKYKECHADQGDTWLRKLAKERERKQIEAYREKLKAEGVPFWKRWIARP